MDIFGSMITGTEVEEAARDTLSAWFPTYLREIEIKQGIPQDSLPRPETYIIAEELDVEHGDRLPCIVLLSPGFAKPPLMEGDGSFRAFFNLGVGVLVSANDHAQTKRLVRLYAAVVRSIVLQHRSLGQFADGCSWQDESYDDNFPFSDEQTISAGTVVFEIEVAGVATTWGGPAQYGEPPVAPDPDAQPGTEWPVIPDSDHVIATVERKG